MGFKSSAVAEAVVKILELPLTPEEFEQQIVQHYAELFPTANLLPGAERLLKHLSRHRIPIALATSSNKENYELKTSKWTDLFSLFNHKVLGGSDPEVIHGKPEPDIFLVAKRRFPDNPDSAMCLVFEDAPNGVQAAVSAGMQVVMIPDSMLPKHYIKDPTLMLTSLEDFKPEMFGLPSYEV